jgi:hypothetical protein
MVSNCSTVYLASFEGRYGLFLKCKTELIERYIKIYSVKDGLLNKLDWFFNDTRRAYVGAAFRVLEERKNAGKSIDVTI